MKKLTNLENPLPMAGDQVRISYSKDPLYPVGSLGVVEGTANEELKEVVICFNCSIPIKTNKELIKCDSGIRIKEGEFNKISIFEEQPNINMVFEDQAYLKVSAERNTYQKVKYFKLSI